VNAVKVLVTGATGFLGAATVARLRANGVWVRALVRRAAAATDADERYVGDLADAESLAGAVAGMDGIVHAGARVSTHGSWDEFEAVNVRGTETLIARAAAAGVRRIVHVSSLSVYGVAADGATISEDSPYEESGAERGFYARSKLAADQIAMRAMGSAPLTVVRPGLLYGPGRRPPLARRVAALGAVRVLFASRDYVLPLAYVENVADAIALALHAPAAAGRAYTIVDVHARQADYARLYRAVSGQRWVAVYVPPVLLRWAASAAEAAAGVAGRRSPVTRHQVDRTLRSATFRTERAHEELGWSPRVPLETALRRTFAAPSATAADRTPAPAHSPA
jgi:nucleoside-diphosphate-sugar epimerase